MLHSVTKPRNRNSLYTVHSPSDQLAALIIIARVLSQLLPPLRVEDKERDRGQALRSKAEAIPRQEHDQRRAAHLSGGRVRANRRGFHRFNFFSLSQHEADELFNPDFVEVDRVLDVTHNEAEDGQVKFECERCLVRISMESCRKIENRHTIPFFLRLCFLFRFLK